MVSVPLFPTDFQRSVAKEASLPLLNRFVENNPSLSTEPFSAISRPGLRKFAEVGTGPVRKVYSQQGVFDNDLFVVSGTFLHRVTTDGVSSSIGEIGTDTTGSVSMAAVAPIAEGSSAYLFIADGGVLWYYTENGSAIGQLEATGAIANTDTVVIDGVYYRWTNGSVDTGTPAGTSGNPWLVALGGTNVEALTNLYNAINLNGAPGTDYSTATTQHPTVNAVSFSLEDLFVAAKVPGTDGNAIAVSETGANIAWTAATLAGGGDEQLRQILMPEDYGAVSVATINSFVIVVPAQTEDIRGRFYWIEPGEIVVDPLNFATAERSPDGVHQVLVYSDMFWLFGQKTTEPWVMTGNPDAPVERFRGILFDRGSWEGSAVQVKDSLLLVDEDGGVFRISNGIKRITQGRPDIEERIRQAILREAASTI